MTLNITAEKLTPSLIVDVEQILEDNYAETGQFHYALNIDWDAYLELGDAFAAFVMRLNTEIVGILFFVICPYPHVKNKVMAQQLTFYVVPKWRKYSLRMMKASEELLKDCGIDIIVQSARYDSPFCKVLDRKGYERADITYIKRLT